MKDGLRMLLCFLISFLSALNATAQADKTRASVDNAIVAFDAVFEKAKTRIAVDLKRKRDYALSSGNLSLTKFLDAEISILRNGDPSPELLFASQELADIKRAQAKTSSTYTNAIKAATKRRDINLAKTLQEELDLFEKRINRMSDCRKCWKAETLMFQQVDEKNWMEADATGAPQFKFKEMSRSDEFIELLDEPRSVTIRVYANKSLIKGVGNDWHGHATGRWVMKQP